MPDPTPDPAVLSDARALDLTPWGYAPGGYVFTCIDCPKNLDFYDRMGRLGDKRSWRCKEHALAAKKAAQPASDAPASGAGEDTVAFVQEWLMSTDYDPTKFDRDFAAAIDARVAAAAPKVASGLERVKLVASALCRATGMDPDGGARSGYGWRDHEAAAIELLAALATDATDGATGGGEVEGTFACPICGEDKPHHHTPAVVDAYQNKRSRT